MGRRVLAFFLGFIFAFILLIGGILIAVMAINVGTYVPSSRDYLGDLANLSIYGVGQELYKKYAEKKGVADENGRYYSLGEFCENYNINLSAALKMEIPQEVLDIPAFEFFNEGGLDNAMKQIKVSAVPAIVNLFGGKNEDGTSNGMFGEDVVAELAKYSMYDLLSNEEIGFAGVFANVRLAQVMPDAFPAEDSDNKLMWALGQSKIGGLLSGMSGNANITLQLKENGAFETLGQLELSALLGENQYITAIMGADAVFADLIDDDGNINLDEIINGVSIGELLGCQKREIEDLEGYELVVSSTEGEGENAATITVKSCTKGSETLYVKSSDGEKWYEAELDCDVTEEGHEHSTDCFVYVWYSAKARAETEQGEATDMVDKDGKRYAKTTGLYAVLSNLSISDLTGGSDNALMEEIKKLTVGEIVSNMEVSGIMETFVDLTIEELMGGAIDEMYLGSFFGFERKPIADLFNYDTENMLTFNKENSEEAAFYLVQGGNKIAMSNDGKKWYEGRLDCEKEHTHAADCYGYVWYREDGTEAEGIQAKLSNKQIENLNTLNDDILELTLLDVFVDEEKLPSMLKTIGNTKIGDLSEEIDNMYLGSFLEYERRLICETDGEHVHTDECYAWYDKNNEVVSGMMAKLADMKVNGLGELNETIKTFTLKDVLGKDVPSMLKALENTEIGQLNEAIKTMRLGDFLEYERRLICGKTEEGEHVHTDECYAWFRLTCDHVSYEEHVENCYERTEGMMAKLADKTVDELGDMDTIVQDFTLRDVLGDSIPQMLTDVADEKISNVGGAVEKIYLGSALGYARKEANYNSQDYPNKVSDGEDRPIIYANLNTQKYVMSEDGKVWYETVRIRNSDGTFKYEYVWYDTDESGNITAPVDGMIKAFVNTKVGNVSGKMDTLTLGEMGIGEGNNILEAMKDTPIKNIGAEINDLEMGVVLGYEKVRRTDTTVCGNNESEHNHTEACYRYELCKHKEGDTCNCVWAAQCADHSNASDHSNHITVGAQNDYYLVKGLNAKIADKTIKDMTGPGMTEIAQSLTIGDLIDSGMMEVGSEESEYKFAIIYCSGDKCEHDCSIAGFVAAKALNNNLTAKDYWRSVHNGEPDIETHKDAWKTCTLSQFMNMLLKAIG